MKGFRHINNGYPGVFILPDGSYFDTRTGFPENTFKVWKDGKYKYLGLTPEAAAHFKKDKPSDKDVIDYINRCDNVEDVEILAGLKPDNVKIQDLALAKIKKINNQ